MLVKESIIYFINEDMGGVGSPMSTLNNTSGMGTAQPALIAATTGTQQYSQSSKGSGDKWGNSLGPYQQGNTKKKRKVYKKKKKTNEQFYPSLKEDSLNPSDKIGVAIAKKLKVPIYFKKGKNQTIHQKKISK